MEKIKSRDYQRKRKAIDSLSSDNQFTCLSAFPSIYQLSLYFVGGFDRFHSELKSTLPPPLNS